MSRCQQMQALVAEYETLVGQQDVLRGEDTNRPHVNVQGARQMIANKQQIREIQTQVESVKDRLMQLVAGCYPKPGGAGSSCMVNRTNSHPLHISIMTEEEFAQVDHVQHTELRNSCVILMHNSANSAVTLALASNVTAVEVHGSTVAVLDAAARYRARNVNYCVDFSAAELHDPNSRPASEPQQKDGMASGEWAAQLTLCYKVGLADKTQLAMSPSESNGTRSSAFSGLPGTGALAKRFDAPTSPELREMAGISVNGEASGGWTDHPQWNSWPRHESGGHDQDCSADSGAPPQESSKETKQALLLYASPAVARATRKVSTANILLLGCWSNIGAVCKRVRQWWSEPSLAELKRR